MRASELSRRLARNAEAVCRRYLSNGRRAGRYWQAGDIRNAKGRSLFVRLAPPGVPGKWTDAATGEHGDLLDLIQLSQGLPDIASAMAETEWFLGQPAAYRPAPLAGEAYPTDRTEIARRLFAEARPVAGTLGEAYLKSRGIEQADWGASLRFHPRAWFDEHNHRPALLAASRDNASNLTGVTRFFFDTEAGLIERRALGRLNGHAVRLRGRTQSSGDGHLIVGEGLESTLSFALLYPEYAAGCDLAATMSAAHMAAFIIPQNVRCLTIATDNGPAGRNVAAKLRAHAMAQGVAAQIAFPRLGDFNDDWMAAKGSR
ncbi:DNA primase [Iodidimonas gelatinilytica]|uniref:DNA primase n=1 Tax=Iodidimonas gelatinilytica TaxID=1236966 RepID=A0A5A7MW41_9PROT|nr:toprim domain-containing protein [Iodidimonas gelatinilytica]GEQ99278.1 DNA primase [Iodidimonas gelatinilytica]